MSKRKLPSASGADTNSTKKGSVVTTHDLLTFLMITVVCFIQALAINGFYGAHGLLSGGITGISFLLDYMFGIPKWVGIVVLNIPVCVVGFICLKPRFVVFSVIGTLMLALAVALTDGFTIPVENELVATLIGAAIIGVTSAPIVKRYATLGALDVVSGILSKRFSGAEDYFPVAHDAILEMYRQVGQLTLNDAGLATRGLLVRHLVLPGCVDDTRRVLDAIADMLPRTTYLSLMRQYAPTPAITEPPLNRKLTDREYDRACTYCCDLGFENVYIQDWDSADLAFTPIFTEQQ